MVRRISVVVAALLLSGCGGESDYTPQSGASGADIFTAACQECHGVNGEGKFGFLLSLKVADHPREVLAGKIRNGGPVMPAFPQVDETAALAVADHLKQVTAQ